MDVEWCKQRLRGFYEAVEAYDQMETKFGGSEWQEMTHRRPTARAILRKLDPAGPDLDDIEDFGSLKARILEGLGILNDYEVLEEKLAPAAPVLDADRLHGWVWEAARPLWAIGQFRQALLTAATAINAQVQTKVGRRDVSDDKLFQECFSSSPPSPGKSRLRIPGDPTDQTVQSQQRGVLSMALGCVWSIRNPAAHLAAHDAGELDEQEAFEQLAALSALSRLLDECLVVTADSADRDNEDQ